MERTTVWRMHLKPNPKKGNLKDVLNFCCHNNIIGVGWSDKEHEFYSLEDLNNYCNDLKITEPKTAERLKADIKPITEMIEGDLIWTRSGEDASIYYLCRVGKNLWKDRAVTQSNRDFDIANFVEVEWVKIGGVSDVPGKVVNSLSARRVVQRVNDIETLSKIYWNKSSSSNQFKYEVEKQGWSDFWQDINSDELETLVFLYLQSEGYYFYKGTVKLNTSKIEGVLVNKFDYHLCFPQVKKNVALLPEDYSHLVENSEDKVVLFTTSENYGDKSLESVRCLSKAELESFITKHNNNNEKSIFPKNIQRRIEWLYQ